MGAKKIIMILVVAVIIAVGVGSYSYATVKADTLESSTTKVTTSSNTTTNTSTTTNANNYTTTNNEENNTTKQTSQNSDNTSRAIANKDNSTANVNNSYIESSSKTVNKELKNSNTSTISSNSTQKTRNNNNTTEGNKKVDMYEYIATDYAYAYVRSEPSNTSATLAQLVSQTKVYVYSESNDWAYIDYQGITGYVHSWELQTTQVADSNGGGDGILVYRTGYIPLSVSGAVDVMSKANANSSIVTKLYPGDSFYVEMEGDGWASISVGSIQGFIPTSDITYTNPN